MRAGRLCVCVAAACCMLASCSVTRKLPAGSYLVQKVTIEADEETPRDERIPASELERYVRQSPNKRFLGLNLGVWIYEQADSAKHNWWNNWKRRIGQEPVLLDMELTEKSADNLKVYMDSKGFLSSRAEYEVDTTSRRKRASILYRTVQHEPYRIDTLSYDFRDRFLAQIILSDTAGTLIRPGEIFDITMLDSERERITSYLRRRGYYDFSVSNVRFRADTLASDYGVGLRVVVDQHLEGYDGRGDSILENNTVYRIGRISILPDYDAAAVRSDSLFASRLDTMAWEPSISLDRYPNLPEYKKLYPFRHTFPSRAPTASRYSRRRPYPTARWLRPPPSTSRHSRWASAASPTCSASA